MIKSCVIGHPIKHSRSPLIHGMWLAELRIDGQYTREDVTAEQLPGFFKRLRAGELAGCNVTLPHKENSVALVDVIDDRVKRTGSLNTVYVRGGILHGTSTDGEGFAANVLWHVPDFQFAGSKVLIVGAGGSARAIVHEMLERGAEQVVIANRTAEKASQIAGSFGRRARAVPLDEISAELSDTSLVINTTSAGIADNSKMELDFKKLATAAVVADINYVPLITSFLVDAQRAGHRIVPGLGMLLHQAVRGFELWFGRRPVVSEELHNAVARDIDPTWAPEPKS